MDVPHQPLAVYQNCIDLIFLKRLFSFWVSIRLGRLAESLDLIDRNDFVFNATFLGAALESLEPFLLGEPAWCAGSSDSNLTLGEGESNDFDFSGLFHL